MYTRTPSGRYPRAMRVPENYGGSAFRPMANEEPEPTEAEIAVPDEPPSTPTLSTPDEPSAKEASAPAGRFSFGLPFLRRDGSGIGFEELLLIGLILLVAEDGKNNDLVWLLLLLLLIS